MPLPRIVTFTTDFGIEDSFVAQMKGAALGVCPELRLVDISHHVPAHDIFTGAVQLRMAYAAFPPYTVHVAVVDPGVGSSRRGVVVRTENYYFVAPDNGLLSMVLDDEPPGIAHVLEASHLRLPKVSPTFEGRDVFAPAAAWIARGIPLERFGPPACDLVRLDLPDFAPRAGEAVPARVLLVDRFGNVTLNVPRRAIETPGGRASRVRVRTSGATVDDFRRTYAEAETAVPFLLFNSAGFLEIAVREGRAAERLGLKAGDDVEVTVER
jgi:S-adenosylmethionine hydrolase